MAALPKENPEKERAREPDCHNDIFGEKRPLGSIQSPNRHSKENGEVNIAANQNDFFSEFEIAAHQAIFGTIIGVAHEFAINSKLDDQANNKIRNEERKPGN